MSTAITQEAEIAILEVQLIDGSWAAYSRQERRNFEYIPEIKPKTRVRVIRPTGEADPIYLGM